MSSAVAPRLATRTVVVADDTAFVRDRFKGALERAGHRAITVSTGNELIARVKADLATIDLVVVDLRLPHGNGVNLVRALRNIDPQKPPIVVFSGTIASATEVRELGALNVGGFVNEYTSLQHILPSLAPHLFPGDFNRRAGPRVVLGIPIAYRFGNTIAAAVTLNISRGGVAVRTTNPLERGITVKVRFRMPMGKKDIDVESKVSWTDRRVGMGLEFVGLADEDRNAIGEFVDAHFFSNRKA
ncbi:MAG TPA: response regulator [Vicinamibacterales bacterium]|nr:response regulator [Vicinamibacterales bacterium]